MAAITVKNVSKKFKIPHQKRRTLLHRAMGLIGRQEDYEEFWAVRDMSFEVFKGETFGIIGRNGSGKSTLLKMLARVLYPDSGTIESEGRVASFLELGVGFQTELSATENIYIYSSILGMKRKEVDKVCEQVYEFAELRKFADMKLKNFSSGMVLRLAFSTAIHCSPDIMLIDEVLAVGDIAFQKKCIKKIKEFQQMGRTIILVSHNLSQVVELCNRSMLMDAGQIISLDDTPGIAKEYQKLMDNTVPLKGSEAQQKGAPLRSVSCRVTNSTAQLVAPSQPAYLQFDTPIRDSGHIYDRGRMTRLVCTESGNYMIFASVEFDISALGRRAIHVRLNGNTVIASQHTAAVEDSNVGTTLSLSSVHYLIAGDYIELGVVHGCSHALNINAKPEYSPVFGLTLLH